MCDEPVDKDGKWSHFLYDCDNLPPNGEEWERVSYPQCIGKILDYKEDNPVRVHNEDPLARLMYGTGSRHTRSLSLAH